MVAAATCGNKKARKRENRKEKQKLEKQMNFNWSANDERFFLENIQESLKVNQI